MNFKKFYNKNLILKTMFFFSYCFFNTIKVAPPTSRQADYAEELVNYRLLMLALTTNIRDLLDKFGYSGIYMLENKGGPNHNNTGFNNINLTTLLNYWDYPLVIDSNNESLKNTTILRLKEDIIYKPDSSKINLSNENSIIYIDRDNVTLDLNGYSLIYDDSILKLENFNEDYNMHGIFVAPGAKNVNVISTNIKDKKGIVKNCSHGYGIYVKGAVDSNVSDVVIDNIGVNNNKSGVYVNCSYNFKINACDVSNNIKIANDGIGNEGTTCYGINLLSVNNCNIINSQINANYGNENTCGIYLYNSNNVHIKNSEISYNKCLNGNVIALNLSGSSSGNVVFESIFNLNTSLGTGLSIGLKCDESVANNYISHCRLFNNKSTQGVNQSYGIYTAASAMKNIFEANKIGNQAYGIKDFALQTNNTYMTNLSMFNSVENFDINVDDGGGSYKQIERVVISPAEFAAMSTYPALFNIEIKDNIF